MRSPKTGGFAPASAETKSIMVPERGTKAAAKPEGKPAQKKAARTAGDKPDAKSTRQ
jgi:hypothetical protein